MSLPALLERPLTRVVIGAGLLAWWVQGLTPWTVHAISEHRADRAVPPSPADVAESLDLLPSSVKDSPAVMAVRATLQRDRAFVSAEGNWNRLVGAELNDKERQLALQLADMRAPTVPPPSECREADGDVVALAQALLDGYGYVDLPVADAPSKDVWAGADRRTRARGLTALVRQHELDPDSAHAILVATLYFLDQTVERSDNLKLMGDRLKVAMGE